MSALDCGHTPTVTTEIGTGTAYDLTGRSMCYGCADSQQAAEMTTADQMLLYLSSDGRSVTTWSGGVLARVTEHSATRTGWYGPDIHLIRATDANGARWYGRNGGNGMCIMLRRAKQVSA